MKLAESDLDVVDLATVGRIHLVGVGGSGMAPLAVLLAERGHQVTGSDLRPSPGTALAEAAGVRVHLHQTPANVAGAGLVVTSTAVPSANVELVEARRLGIPVVHRGRVLGALTRVAPTVVVAGTHGKSSTTSMLTLVLDRGGADPGCYVGAEIRELRTGARWRSGPFVVEGDESDGTLLELAPDTALLTNVEPDHLDHWGSVDELVAGFARFLASARGPVLVCADDPVAARLGRVVGASTYGYSPQSEFRIEPAGTVGPGRQRFTLHHGAAALGVVELPLRGRHMAANAAGAAAMGVLLGIPFSAVQDALAGFGGVARRFDIRARAGGVTLVDDYAHLPGEIAATLAAARANAAIDGWQRVVAVFQPNRPNRMAVLSPDYADAFVDADVVVISDIYLSGETPIPGVTGELVVDAVRRAHPGLELHYVPDRAGLAAAVAPLLRPGDVCISMGCGDVASLPDEVAPLLGGGGQW